MGLLGADVNPAPSAKNESQSVQNASQDTLKAPVDQVFRGFFVSGRPVRFMPSLGFWGCLWRAVPHHFWGTEAGRASAD